MQKQAMIVLLILIELCGFASATTIYSTTVSGNQLTIGGVGFSGTLTVALNNQKLTIVSSTPTQIAATMNPVPAPGSYRLVVKAGTVSTFAYVTISSEPVIVAQLSFVNQSQPINGTLFTPATNGVFRISSYANTTQCCQASSFQFGWTDEIGAHVTSDPSFVDLFIPFIERIHVVRSIGGQAITYTALDPSDSQYSWYITVEQLQ
jgi:hypothetical protein